MARSPCDLAHGCGFVALGPGGGRSLTGFGWDVLVVAIWSVVVLLLALRSALDSSETSAKMARVDGTS